MATTKIKKVLYFTSQCRFSFYLFYFLISIFFLKRSTYHIDLNQQTTIRVMEDNPFRPEGELAREAEQFVQELKMKAERDLNELIHNTTSSTISQSALSHTVNEILAEPKEARAASPVKTPTKSSSSTINKTTTPLKDSTNTTTASTKNIEIKIVETSTSPSTQKTPEKKTSKKSVDVNNTTNKSDVKTKTKASNKKESDENVKKTSASSPSKEKKAKAKCGCVIS